MNLYQTKFKRFQKNKIIIIIIIIIPYLYSALHQDLKALKHVAQKQKIRYQTVNNKKAHHATEFRT